MLLLASERQRAGQWPLTHSRARVAGDSALASSVMLCPELLIKSEVAWRSPHTGSTAGPWSAVAEPFHRAGA